MDPWAGLGEDVDTINSMQCGLSTYINTVPSGNSGVDKVDGYGGQDVSDVEWMSGKGGE